VSTVISAPMPTGRDRPASRHPADHGERSADRLPPAIDNVYSPAELVLLALTGLVIAVVSVLAPASWAARARTATALRTE
jgi:ABC-type lipoprotein release transport system permease subunit